MSERRALARLIENVEGVLLGKRAAVETAVAALLARGHVLVEDVPGMGKTVLARSLARSVHAEFRRVQCTPDLLPSDVTGVSIYDPRELRFEFRPGEGAARPRRGADRVRAVSPAHRRLLVASVLVAGGLGLALGIGAAPRPRWPRCSG